MVLYLGKGGKRTVSVTAAVENKVADKVAAGTTLKARDKRQMRVPTNHTTENPRKHEKGADLTSVLRMVAQVLFCLP